jgi:hypothetical protein
MSSEFRQYSHLNLVREIGRNFLAKFLESFAPDFAARHISLPSPDLGDTAYFTQALEILSLPEQLPEQLLLTLSVIAQMTRSQSMRHLSEPGRAIAKPRYAIRKGFGFWDLTFDHTDTVAKHEKGVFYFAHLLTNPPEHPIHALDLIAQIPEMYRKQLGIQRITDPASGKLASLGSSARLQERSLVLDDAETMRALLRKEKELESILDDENESEPVKAEALRELEQITDYQKQHGGRTKDGAQRAAQTVRQAMTRFYHHLLASVDKNGNPHPVLCPFALYLQNYILIPSARYSGHGGPYARDGMAGRFTYEPPPGHHWVC